MTDTRPLTVATATGPINARIDGRPDGPWTVFSNSHGTNLSMWDDQVAALCERFRILRYDQRGHGGTPPLDDPQNFDALAADLVAVMDAAGARRAVLVGASMGGVTVARVAALHPDRVIAVISADGQWRAPPTGHAVWQERIDRVKVEGTGPIAPPTVTRWCVPGLEQRDPALFERIRAMVAGTSPQGYIACAQALQAYDISADFPNLSVPALFMAGEQDGALPTVVKAMAEATPGARLHIIPAAGHLPNLEQPAAFLRAVEAFLKDSEVARGLV